MQARLLTVDRRCWAGNCLKPKLEKVLLGGGQTVGPVTRFDWVWLEPHWFPTLPLLVKPLSWPGSWPDTAKFLCQTERPDPPISWIRDSDRDHDELIIFIYTNTSSIIFYRCLQSLSLCWWICCIYDTTLTCQLLAQLIDIVVCTALGILAIYHE